MGIKKRTHEDATLSNQRRLSKKQKRIEAYHSDSESVDDDADFKAVNLADSDEDDLDNVEVDDGASGNSDGSSDSAPEDNGTGQSKPKRKPKPEVAHEDASSADTDAEDDDEEEEEGSESDPSTSVQQSRSKKSKRNDPTAFATSLSKILNTKLSSSRRKDPLLAGSAAAHAASRAVADSALETKARKALRDQKRVAMEKGRVRDVLAPDASGLPAPAATVKDGTLGKDAQLNSGQDGLARSETTTAQLIEKERRLRKIAQRGVVKLFNAVRAAQVKAAEADRAARADGVIGQGAREERVAEMSRKGFLDLIAKGGGGLKKGSLEEA